VNGAFWLPTIAPFSMRYACAVDSAKIYAHSGALPAKELDIEVMGVASVVSPVAFPIKIWLSASGRMPIARATSWPLGNPTCDDRSRLRTAKSAGPSEEIGNGNKLNELVIEASILYDACTAPPEVFPPGRNNDQSIPKFVGDGLKPTRSMPGVPKLPLNTGTRFVDAFTRYRPRTIECPNRYAATLNSTGICAQFV